MRLPKLPNLSKKEKTVALLGGGLLAYLLLNKGTSNPGGGGGSGGGGGGGGGGGNGILIVESDDTGEILFVDQLLSEVGRNPSKARILYAISYTETGAKQGKFGAAGEFTAFQFMPSTWDFLIPQSPASVVKPMFIATYRDYDAISQTAFDSTRRSLALMAIWAAEIYAAQIQTALSTGEIGTGNLDIWKAWNVGIQGYRNGNTPTAGWFDRFKRGLEVFDTRLASRLARLLPGEGISGFDGGVLSPVRPIANPIAIGGVGTTIPRASLAIPSGIMQAIVQSSVQRPGMGSVQPIDLATGARPFDSQGIDPWTR